MQREAGDYLFNDNKIVDYPFFIDLRGSSFARHPVNGSLPQLTMAWASPLSVEGRSGRRVTKLLWSSQQAWLSDSEDIAPRVSERRQPEGETDRHLLGAIVQGHFKSAFSGPPA